MDNPDQYLEELDNSAELNRFYQVFRGLEALADLQRPTLEHLGYHDSSTETLSRYGLALIIEVAEFLNEAPWKAWKKDPTKPPDLERLLSEFSDMLCYVGSWICFLQLIGIEPHNISHAYQQKLAENNRRFGVQQHRLEGF